MLTHRCGMVPRNGFFHRVVSLYHPVGDFEAQYGKRNRGVRCCLSQLTLFQTCLILPTLTGLTDIRRLHVGPLISREVHRLQLLSRRAVTNHPNWIGRGLNDSHCE
jgi:hypothetical protein